MRIPMRLSGSFAWALVAAAMNITNTRVMSSIPLQRRVCDITPAPLIA
jgi:hypothetical protein